MLLILDQATQLDDEVLEDLNNLALLAPNALHLMLIATPEFEEKLSQLSEPKAPIHVVDIDDLPDDETTTLLLQSFPDKEWSEEEIEYILHNSEGNPGKTIYIAQEFFSGNKTLSTTATATSKFPIVHIAALAIVAIILSGFYFYQSSSQDNAAKLVDKESINAVQQPAIEINNTDSQPISKADGGRVDKSDEASGNAEVISTVAVTPVSEANTSSAAITENVSDEVVDFNFSNNVPVEQGKSEPLTVTEKTTEPKSTVEKIKTDTPLSDKTEINGNFVIQLFGSYDQKSAKSFMRTYTSAEISLRLYQTVNNGQPWYVVVSKPYANRANAKDQVSKLPSKLRSQGPWVRTVESLSSK
jgi:DamX protein